MRNYNVDSFDWGDGEEPGTVALTPEVSIDYVYAKIHNVVEATRTPRTLPYVRPSKLDLDRPKPTYKVEYGLRKDQKEWLVNEFPGYNLDFSGYKHHDHPCAHVARELNEMEMLGNMGQDHYIDLFGNAGRNRKWGRNATTLVSMASAKDYLRYREDKGQVPLVWEKLYAGGYGQAKAITCTHALYYLDLQEIHDIARLAEFRCIVHRHPGTHGWLNNGEQEYWVTKEGVVTQENTATGEKYQHQTLEAFFHQNTAKVGDSGLVWTTNKLGGDTYMLTFAQCPVELADEFKPLHELVKQEGTITVINDVVVYNFLHWTWYSKKGSNGQVIDLTDVTLVNELRRYVAGRVRNSRNYENLFNYARRLTNVKDVIAVHGGTVHNIPIELISEYVNFAFYVDVKREIESAIYHYRENKEVVSALNTYYNQGSLPTNLTSLHYVVDTLKVGSDVACDIGTAASNTAVALVRDRSIGNWTTTGSVFPTVGHVLNGRRLDKCVVEDGRDLKPWVEAWAAASRKAKAKESSE